MYRQHGKRMLATAEAALSGLGVCDVPCAWLVVCVLGPSWDRTVLGELLVIMTEDKQLWCVVLCSAS
jgi:hypothetical protein